VLSLTAGVSSPSKDCAQENQKAENDEDDGPDVVPEVDDVSACLQEQG